MKFLFTIGSLLLVLAGQQFCVGLNNGLAMTPPMGWRSWNQFQCNGFGGVSLNQDLLTKTVDVLVDRSRGVSLQDVGFIRAGLDDCWQLCGAGANGDWHDANGNPIVNTTRFPDFSAWTAYAHSKRILADWYLNNCHCRSNCSTDECFSQDAAAISRYGFDGVKFDGCSAEKDISRWAELLNATGQAILIENCHNGPNFPDPSKTPLEQSFHYFRSSGDIRPTYSSVMNNLQSVRLYVTLTGPGSWAYPDMLEVGVTNSQRTDPTTLSFLEAQSHFGAWCVVSSPLILGFDVTDKKALRSVWDIITNTEAIAVNQAWAGHPGDLVTQAGNYVHLNNCDWNDRQCALPLWQVWGKPLAVEASGVSEVALFLANHDYNNQTVTINFSDAFGANSVCATSGCAVRDVWSHLDLGLMTSFTVNLVRHQSAFIRISLPPHTASHAQPMNLRFAPPPTVEPSSCKWEPVTEYSNL